MIKYSPQKIEKKWQNIWYKSNGFKAKNFSEKEKFYLMFEFPYPSGDGLHVGHCRPYIALDIIARYKRMQGYNVLFPMGWDAFGLPTENYAIKTGVHPSLATKKNTDNFKKQMNSIGLSLDWSREINTTDPDYYRWTQWIFIKLFEKGLAYKKKMNINWCPSCKIGLANEEVISGNCERCGTKTEKKEKEQWVIKITKYADRLLEDLDLVDYPERVKTQQKEWIGKSEGEIINFAILGFKKNIEVFTTRPDTIFGCTFLVLAPEHDFIQNYKSQIKNYNEVADYVNKSKNKSDLERQENREKTGIELKGIKAVNPANGREVPIFVADYIMLGYGTGAIMAVPADDARDKEFAEKYNLPVIENYKKAKFGDFGKKVTQYKIRDWIFSRQHYWGEPIPMIFCEDCGWQAVPEKDLPVELPKVKNYHPTDTGESPLSHIKKWVNVKCPKCKGPAYRETDTMPNWAGSNWYYLAYLAADKKGKSKFKIENSKLTEYWMPVDWYNGGMEHTTLHLLYSRFIFKFLWDIGAVPKSIGPEPYKKRTSHGMILGEGGIKMSKSKGNVINPNEVIAEYGADTLRVYEMFMGPFEQMIPWDTRNIVGCRRFLEKIYKLTLSKNPKSSGQKLVSALHKTIKKIGEDIEEMKFNTAISSLMQFANEWHNGNENLDKTNLKKFLVILSPFAPHLAAEIWQEVGFKGEIHKQNWPSYEKSLIKEEKAQLIIQINGKVRDQIEILAGINQSEAEKLVMQREKIKQWIGDKEIKKIIFIKYKLVNIVL